MIRPLLIAGTLSSFAILAACQNDTRAMSDTSSGYTDYGRVDANGNRVYGPYNTPATRDDSRGMNAGNNGRAVTMPSNNGSSNMNNSTTGSSYIAGDRVYTNTPGTPVREYGANPSTPLPSNSAGDWATAWNDHDAKRIGESDLPQAVRNTLAYESNGNTLSETSKGTWNGQTAYSAQVVKNGHTYKIVTDANGNLISSRIVD